MKRVLFLTGMAAIWVVTLCLFCANKYILALMVGIVLCAAAILLFARDTKYTKAFLFILAVSLLFSVRYYIFYNYEVKPVINLQGKTSNVEMLLNDVETLDTKQFITAKVVKSENNLPTDFKVYFNYYGEEQILSAGDRISLMVSYRPVSQYSQSKCYSEGIYISCIPIKEPSIIGHSNTLQSRFSNLRTTIRERLFKHLPYNESSLMCGLLLSDTSYMTESVYSAMQRCGLTHLTAVSGTHLSVFCYSIYRFLQKFLNKGLSAWLTMPSVIFVMAISGFTPSVTRAGIMALLFLAGVGLFKRVDNLNSLGLAATVLLLLNPYNLLNKGFVLSFAAMVGMVLLVPYFTNRLPKTRFKVEFFNSAIEYITTSLVCSIVASLCTAPASILFFGEISLISPIVNLLCVYPAMLSMMIGAVALFLPFLVYAVRPLLSFILWITKLFSTFPFASVDATPSYIKIWIGATFVLLGMLLLFKRMKPVLCILLSIAMLIVSIISYRVLDNGVVHIAFANTENGIVTLIVKNKTCIAIGMGGKNAKYFVPDYCDSKGVKNVPVVLLPSTDSKYCNFHVLDNDKFETVLIPPNNLSANKTLENMGKRVIEIGEVEITPFKNFKVKIVASGNGYVVQWAQGNYTGIICMGTNTIPENLQNIDYIFTDTDILSDYYFNGKTKVFLAADYNKAMPIVSSLIDKGLQTYMIDNGETAELLIRNGKTVSEDKF